MTPATVSGKPAKQDSHARDVAVVLARLIGAAEVDIVDRAGLDTRALDGSRDRDRREVVRPHVSQRPAVAADRRSNC